MTNKPNRYIGGLVVVGEDSGMMYLPKGTSVLPNSKQSAIYEKGDEVKMDKQTIQESAKEKVIALLTDYDVAYIDYDAKEDEYSIRLDKEKLESEGVYADGEKVAESIYRNVKVNTYKLSQQETDDGIQD